MQRNNIGAISEEIATKLKNIPEQQTVTGPLVAYLLSIGWRLEQMVFGKREVL